MLNKDVLPDDKLHSRELAASSQLKGQSDRHRVRACSKRFRADRRKRLEITIEW
jgi:hypothetical protein